MHLAAQPANQRSVQHGPLVLVSEPRKFHAPTIDRDRTVSRRSEPSSRATLMGEQYIDQRCHSHNDRRDSPADEIDSEIESGVPHKHIDQDQIQKQFAVLAYFFPHPLMPLHSETGYQSV